MKELLSSNYNVALTVQPAAAGRTVHSQLQATPGSHSALRRAFSSRRDWFLLLYRQIIACNIGSVFAKWGVDCCL